jgi:putative toxin-antitoxin system antitoxin component (TIGR02293 family)
MAVREVSLRFESPLPVEDIRVSRCLSKAIDTFDGDWEKAAEWMHTPNLALGERKPFEVAQDSEGERRVITLLTQIDHGTYS